MVNIDMQIMDIIIILITKPELELEGIIISENNKLKIKLKKKMICAK